MSITLKLRPSVVKGKKGSIYIRFIKDRKIRSITTPYKLYEDEWNEEKSSIRIDTFNPDRSRYLIDISVALKNEIEELESKVRRMEDSGGYSLDDILNFYFRKNRDHMLSCFVEKLKRELIENNQYRTADAYQSVVNNIRSFNSGSDVSLNSIDASFLKRFEAYMKMKNNSLNTISFYMRNLRAIYYKAVRERIVDKKNDDLFREVYTGICKTKKRAIKKEILDQFLHLDLLADDKKHLDFARDMFLISFYLRGISFIDLAYLKKDNVKGNMLTYVRRKTKQKLEIEMIPEIRRIVNKYVSQCKDSIYLLPILLSGNSRKKYAYALARQNRCLRVLSKMMKLDTSLTTYVSRHSWATIARSKGFPLSVISLGLGHDSEKTTIIYLDSFDFSFLHKANRDIVHYTKKVS